LRFSFCFRLIFVWGEIIDYTESIFFVNRSMKLFQLSSPSVSCGEVSDYTELKIFVNRSVSVLTFLFSKFKTLTSETSDYTDLNFFVNRLTKL